MPGDSIDGRDRESRKELGDSRIDTEGEACDLDVHPDRLSGRYQQHVSESNC
ncbi:MAG: hypothetical protein ACREV7_16100 [Steroidobacteraceae bacterium]